MNPKSPKLNVHESCVARRMLLRQALSVDLFDQLGVFLIEDDAALISHEVVLVEAPDQWLDEVGWEWAWGRFRLTVVVSQDRLHSLGGFAQLVVGDLREQVVHHMCANVVVNLVEDAIVPING